MHPLRDFAHLWSILGANWGRFAFWNSPGFACVRCCSFPLPRVIQWWGVGERPVNVRLIIRQKEPAPVGSGLVSFIPPLTGTNRMNGIEVERDLRARWVLAHVAKPARRSGSTTKLRSNA